MGLEAVKGERTVSELEAEYGVQPGLELQSCYSNCFAAGSGEKPNSM